MGRLPGVLHHALGFPEGRRCKQRDRGQEKGRWKNTVLTWSPAVKAPSGKNYVINGYVNEQNFVERVETWLGDNIMGDMHIVATYSGWKDFRRSDGSCEDRANPRRMALLRGRRDGGEA